MAVLSGGRARRAAVALVLSVAIAGTAAATSVGDVAPSFTLPDVNGRSMALAAARGRVVIVDFWASWCMPCAPLLPALDALARRYEGRVEVFAIDVDQSRAKADAFLRDRLPQPSAFVHVLVDPEAEVLARYGAAGMPALFVVAPDGRIRLTDVGYSPERLPEVDAMVRSLLATPAAAATAMATPIR